MAQVRSGTLHPGAHAGTEVFAGREVRPRTRRLVLGLLIVLGLMALVGLVVEEPLRRTLERRVNASLDGYTATIGRVDLRWLGLGVDLHDVTVVQNALPHPPTIYLPRWSTSIQWRALLSGAFVADTTFTRPQVYLTFAQAKEEAAEPTPATEHGWQDAVTSIYPLKINHLRIENGEVTYFDAGELPPVVLRRLMIRADDIRNVRSAPGRYPSRLRVDATLADGAHVDFRGRADFLAVPRTTLKGRFEVDNVSLAQFAPVARHAGFDVTGGRLAANGRVEQTQKQARLDIERVSLDAPRIDYVLRKTEDRVALEKATKVATTSEPAPTNRLDVAEAVIRNGTFGIVDGQASPPYRLWIDQTAVRVRNFSNQRAARRGSAVVDGRVMGSGSLHLEADFAPTAKKPDFAMKLRLEDVELPKMNDFLRAQAGIDVVSGWLSFYSEITVRDGRIDGYAKPLFRAMDVYDRGQDREKGPFRQAYEAIVGAATTLLENRPRDEVATVTNLSGPVENPESSTWEILGNLLRNAFIQAILPGLEPGRQRRE